MVVMVMPSAALSPLLNLGKCLLRAGEIAGLKVLAQRLKFLRERRLVRLPGTCSRSRSRS
jgi:hypothetical protein